MWTIAGAVVLGSAVFVATSDPNYRVERSIRVDAPPDKVFAVLRDFQQFQHWSPWEKLDPQMEKTFDGEAGEVGASYHWSGNKKVGEGTMTIVEVQPDEGVAIRLEFLKPFASVCQTRWGVSQEGEHTIVTWSMKGKHQNFLNKLFGLVMNMKKMLSKDFDEGLSRLKGHCESNSQVE